jgi:hypothetical protein
MVASRAKTGLVLLGLLPLFFVGAVSLAGGDQPKKDDPAAADKETIDTKATPRPTAAGIKFRKELGLPLASLSTLGSRIDAARQAHDPVALAHAANELAVAEKVSGKKASLTSTALAKESAELAKLRRQELELRATLAIQDQIIGAEANVLSLKKAVADAKAQAKADSDAIRRSQEPTWKPLKLIVNNNTTLYVGVYVNGHFKGQVCPGMSQAFLIEHRWNPTVLTGDGDEAEQTYGPVTIWGRFNKYTWNIN